MPNATGSTRRSPPNCKAPMHVSPQTKSKAVTAIGDIAADTARAVVAKLIGQDISPDEVKKVLRPAPGE